MKWRERKLILLRSIFILWRLAFVIHNSKIFASQRIHFVFLIETNQSVLLKDLIDIYFKNHTKHISTLCGKIQNFLISRQTMCVIVTGRQTVSLECWACIGKGCPFMVGLSLYYCDVGISSLVLVRSVMSTELERAVVPFWERRMRMLSHLFLPQECSNSGRLTLRWKREASQYTLKGLDWN